MTHIATAGAVMNILRQSWKHTLYIYPTIAFTDDFIRFAFKMGSFETRTRQIARKKARVGIIQEFFPALAPVLSCST
jgi:hypothetical protein